MHTEYVRLAASTRALRLFPRRQPQRSNSLWDHKSDEFYSSLFVFALFLKTLFPSGLTPTDTKRRMHRIRLFVFTYVLLILKSLVDRNELCEGGIFVAYALVVLVTEGFGIEVVGS